MNLGLPRSVPSQRGSRKGAAILQLQVFAQPYTRQDSICRWIVNHCRRLGYLEYVCPQCEQTLDFHIKREEAEEEALMKYPQHYRGTATVYDMEQAEKGSFPTCQVTKAVLRSRTELALDLQAEDGTRHTFTLKSLSGKWFSGHSGAVTIRRTGVLVSEEEETCYISGKWQAGQQEEWGWYAELSLSD